MIKIGDVLILELTYSDKREKYKCRLVERKGNHLYIDYPINTDTQRTAFLLDGTQLKGSFVSNETTVFMFDSEILGRVKQNIPMLILAYPGDEHLIKIQRRQYVRIETPVDIALHPTNQEFQPFTTVTDDISAGGAAVISTNSGLKQGLEIMSWIVLPMQNGEYYYTKLKSKVIRLTQLDEYRSKASIQFLEVEPNDRQMLLRFCFDRQLMMRKKGLD